MLIRIEVLAEKGKTTSDAERSSSRSVGVQIVVR
jgi:hypothetical protein